MNQRGLYPQLFVKWRLLDVEDFLLLGAVVTLPWFFGGVPIYGFRTAAGLLGIGCFVMLLRSENPLAPFRGRRWLWPAFALVLFAAFQLVPLPPGLVATLSPEADAIYRDTFPGYGGGDVTNVVDAMEAHVLEEVPEAAEHMLPPREDVDLFPSSGPGGRWTGWRPLSLMPEAGKEALLWFVALLIGFVAMSHRVRNSDTWDQYRAMLFSLFLVLSAFGLFHAATAGPGTLYWVFKPWFLEGAKPFGPYVNPNNFAAVMEMAAPWIFGYTLVRARRMRWNIFADVKTVFFGSVAILCTLSGIATGSKFSAPVMAGSLSLLAIIAAPRSKRWIAILVVIALLAAGTGVAAMGFLGERVTEFLSATEDGLSSVNRWQILPSAIDLIGDFAIVGCGFGAFRDVFAHYVPPGDEGRWEHLHNDYLQVVAEGGAIGGVLVLLLTLGFLYQLFVRGAWRSRHSIDLELVGLAFGLLSLMAHAVVDFNHQIPANALLFVTLAALALARTERLAARREGRG